MITIETPRILSKDLDTTEQVLWCVVLGTSGFTTEILRMLSRDLNTTVLSR